MRGSPVLIAFDRFQEFSLAGGRGIFAGAADMSRDIDAKRARFFAKKEYATKEFSRTGASKNKELSQLCWDSP